MTSNTAEQANPQANAPDSVAANPSRPNHPLLTPPEPAQALASSQRSLSGDAALGHAGALITSGPVRLLLTPREAAKALSISERSLWQLGKDGEIPRVEHGRLVRFDVTDLRRWIEQNKRKSKNHANRQRNNVESATAEKEGEQE
jgi:excisionase family DNA binding protein